MNPFFLTGWVAQGKHKAQEDIPQASNLHDLTAATGSNCFCNTAPLRDKERTVSEADIQGHGVNREHRQVHLVPLPEPLTLK